MCICYTIEFFFFKQKTAYEMRISDWIRRVLFRSYTAIAFRQQLRIAAPALIMDLRPGSVEFKRTELRLTELNVSNDLRLIVKNGMPINDRTADNELRGKIGRASCRERVCQYV